MNLRLTMLVLAVVTILSASAGGYVYNTSLHKTALIQAERKAYNQLRASQKNITSFLSENIKPVRTLAGMPEIKAALANKQHVVTIAQANSLLDHFTTTLEAEACYILDANGLTIASSNRNAPESFVGKNFSFRPYFQKAMKGASATYLALGTTSDRRGIYCSYPVFHPTSIEIIGAAVIKASIERVEHELSLNPGENIILADPNGLIFISTNPEWLFTLIDDLPEQTFNLLRSTRQFGEGPWPSSGLRRQNSQYFTNRDGSLLFSVQTEIDHYPGWSLIYLGETEVINQHFSDSLIRITGPLIFIFCLSIGTSVLVLYSKASSEIIKRKSTQAALASSEKRYRHLYEKTPAMLHSIDHDGKLLNVSDHWLNTLEYTRAEVIGHHLTNFYTEESRQHAEQVVIPSFFKTGHCENVPYQFIKKSGEKIDVLLSAIAERDKNNNISRSITISVDVTERNRAQNALQLAKEKLSRYSLSLERKVRERTVEINSILTNTPDVIYIVDRQGHFKLINRRFETIFAQRNDLLCDQTFFSFLPAKYATPIHNNHLTVLEKKSPIQVEEIFPQSDAIHTYLSVKFPIYDEQEHISSICSISTDVTELYKAQAQLRRLSASIMDGQEKERTAIARELHDELGQVLTALRMEALSLHDRLCDNDIQGSQRAERMCQLIDTTIDEVRGMAIRLRPGVLDDLGLIDALEWYTADFEKRTGITCIFEHHNKDVILPNTLTTAAYRIAQEALTNAARYANSQSIDVSLVIDSTFVLTIRDYGQGFNTTLLNQTEGLGIAGMQERASLTGGTLSVASIIGEGTTIQFTTSPGGWAVQPHESND